MSCYINSNLLAKDVNHKSDKRFNEDDVKTMARNIGKLYLSKRPEIVFSEKKDLINAMVYSLEHPSKLTQKTTIVKNVINADTVMQSIKNIYVEVKKHNEQLSEEHAIAILNDKTIPRPKLKDIKTEISNRIELPETMIFYEESLIYITASDIKFKQSTLHLVGIPKKKIVSHIKI